MTNTRLTLTTADQDIVLISNTVRIGARRFEQSPFFECYASPDTLLGVAANRYYAADNGENIEETYWSLRQKMVLFDVPEKPWQIEGPDAVPFLEQSLPVRLTL